MLTVDLVSPERVAFSGEAKMVTARTTQGDIAFLSGHVPFVGLLQTHRVQLLLPDDTAQVVAVHEGFIEVAGEGGETRVTILSDVCELAESIDVRRAEAARERAMHILADRPDDEEAQAALRRAEVRIEVGEGSTQ